jgi:hypothetical protein
LYQTGPRQTRQRQDFIILNYVHPRASINANNVATLGADASVTVCAMPRALHDAGFAGQTSAAINDPVTLDSSIT